MRICNSLLTNCYLVEIFNDTSGISPLSLRLTVTRISFLRCCMYPINSTVFLKKPYSQKSQHFFSTVYNGKFNTHVGSKVPCCKALRVNLRNFPSSPSAPQIIHGPWVSSASVHSEFHYVFENRSNCLF